MAHYLHLVVSAHVIIRSPLLTYWGEMKKKKKNPGMYAFLLLKPQSMISSPAAASAS